MLSKEQVLDAIKGGRESECIDHRDYLRLIDFFETEDAAALGFTLKEGYVHEPKEWTRENIVAQMQEDVDFGFEKALDKRGLSAGAMFEVVRMWLWILEDELGEEMAEQYAMYGLPLFKAVALKYGFENQIGDDTGSEDFYNA